MSNIKYLRKFIILEPTEPTIKIKGYSKIEVRDGKGKLEINVDGISDRNKGYDIYLLTEEEVKFNKAKFGTLYDTGNGKALFKKEFNPQNVLNSDKGIDAYNIVAVKHSDSEILYGYIHKEKDEINVKALLSEEQVNKETDYDTYENKNEDYNPDTEVEDVKYEQEAEEQEVYEDDNIESEVDVEEYNEVEEEYPELEIETEPEIEPEVEELNTETAHTSEIEIEKEHDESAESVDYPNADDKIEDYYFDKSQKELEEYKKYQQYKSKENIDNYNSEYGYSINKNSEENINNPMSRYTLNVLNYFNEVDPFKINLKEYRFWEITEDSVNIRRGFLPYYNYVVNMHYPYSIMNRMTTASRQIRKYRHYLFGVVSENDKDVKHFVYGIPGKFSRQEQPYRGMSGFTTWLEKSDSNKEEKTGYWLIHIDAKTGRIVTPLRPTNPL